MHQYLPSTGCNRSGRRDVEIAGRICNDHALIGGVEASVHAESVLARLCQDLEMPPPQVAGFFFFLNVVRISLCASGSNCSSKVFRTNMVSLGIRSFASASKVCPCRFQKPHGGRLLRRGSFPRPYAIVDYSLLLDPMV